MQNYNIKERWWHWGSIDHLMGMKSLGSWLHTANNYAMSMIDFGYIFESLGHNAIITSIGPMLSKLLPRKTDL